MGRAWRWHWMAPTGKQQSQNAVQEVVWSYSTVAKIFIQTRTQSHLQLDSSNHPYVDKQVDTSLPTCVQAQICRGAHAQVPPHPGRCTHSLPLCTWANTQAGVLLMLTYMIPRYTKKKNTNLRKKAPTLSSDSLAWNPYSSGTWGKWCGKENVLLFLQRENQFSPGVFCYSDTH